MMSSGLAWMASTLKSTAVAGVAATLSRQGSGTPTSLNVVSQDDGGDGQYATQLGSTPEDSVFVLAPPEAGYCGFLIVVGDYLIDGVAVKPERGDVLTISGQTFQVSSPDGTLPWKYHPNPQLATWYWVHTKLSA